MSDFDLTFRETARACSSKPGLLTYDDYRKTPPGQRFELVEGVLRRMDSPTVLHQDVLQRLWLLLYLQVQTTGRGKVYLAPLDVLLSDHNVVQPDILLILTESLGIIGKENVSGPPDLVVEVLSPSTNQWDRQIKRQLYAKYGVREYWLVDTEAQTVEVLALDRTSPQGPMLLSTGLYAAGSHLKSALLPDIVIEIAGLFE